MKNWGKLEAIVATVVIGLVFLTVMVLAGAIPGIEGLKGEGSGVTLSTWGFLMNDGLKKTFEAFNSENKGSIGLSYVAKDRETYEEKLLDALAGGVGPDIFMMTQDMVLKHKNKAYIIPKTVLSERAFLDVFVDSAEIFWTGVGTIAIPFAIDPLVMYWNRDLFNRAGIASPPRYWDDFIANVKQLTDKDDFSNIFQSGTSLGEYINVRNAKDIISMLVLQSGSEIVKITDNKVKWAPITGGSVNPMVSALTFYTNFSNPSKTSYSWNRALPDSRDMFLSGKLAMYFGFASEYDFIKSASPHLNFDVAIVPQVENSSVRATYGKVYAFAISKNSFNRSKALEALLLFTSPPTLSVMAEDSISLPPSRRDLIGQSSPDSEQATFYSATLLARSWPEPGLEFTSNIFQNMIESVVTGRESVSRAISIAESFFRDELKKY